MNICKVAIFSADMEELCQDYLQNITPVAQRMAEDITRIKNENKTIWPKLTNKERNDLINKLLIDTHLESHYQNTYQNSALHYESLSTFSWFSTSQCNLCKFIDNTPNRKVLCSEVINSVQKNSVSNEKTKELTKPTQKMSSDEKNKQNTYVLKPKNPPPPPPSKPSFEDENDMLQSDMPKTGFDFLDNW